MTILWAAALAVGAAAQAPHPSPTSNHTIIYVTRAGDTLDALSHNFLVPERRWRALLEIAGIRNPRHLPVGRALVIPRSWLRFKLEPARLASYRGTVNISARGASLEARPGASIGEGTQVATGANSFLTLILADQSKVVIPSHSRATLTRLRRILLTGVIDYRIDVDSGRLETKVTPITNPAGRYRIQTPVSMTAVRGTEFRVTFEPDRETAGTELLSGAVALSGPSGAQAIALDSSFGASMSRASPPQIERLLPGPDMALADQLQTQDLVTFNLSEPVPGATGYRAVIATDAGFVDNIAEQFSDSGSFSFADVPNGTHFVRISAISPSGLEGVAQAYSFTRRLASISGAVSPEKDGYRFRWLGAGTGVRRYRFQLMANAPDTRPVVDEVGLDRDSILLRLLPRGIYYWRVELVQVDNGEMTATWTEPEKLTIGAAGETVSGR